MYVVMISPELAPAAKVGGLADVVFGLSRELEIRGHSVEIILPKYNNIRYDQVWGLQEDFHDLWVPWYGGAVHCSVWFGFVHGRKCFFIDPHSRDEFFNRGLFYGAHDDPVRFSFFCRAALEFMLQSNKHPDIIHTHDWQTGLVPVLLYAMYAPQGMTHPRVCYTIHNFKHQGVYGPELLHATGLGRPEYFMHYDRMRDNHNPSVLNLMKSGIVYSNFITTVSPHHAWEAQHTDQGHGLGHTLHIHRDKFGGVLNGIDYDTYNPETDPHIPFHYNIDRIDAKYGNKEALRDRLLIRKEYKPLISFIGRLDPQKGLDLVRHAMFYTINNGGQFVLLGSSPDPRINDYFWHLKHHINDDPDSHIEVGFHEELARLIYAGSDLIIVPSHYEPCGLTQMIALRYGTVPIVRAVGGLVDTVFDKDYDHRPLHERNGFVFKDADNGAIESALHRAMGCWYSYPDDFRHVIQNGMKYDFSWNFAGQHYLSIYDHIRE